MKDSQPKEIRLEDYSAAGYTTKEVDLNVDIYAGETTVTSLLKIEQQDVAANSIYLDGQEQTLVSVKLDGRLLSENEYQLDDEGLEIFGLEAHHELEIVSKICPEENTALEGLYKSSQMYCTQCEAQGFRKITYYQDRPDVLAKFTTTVVADGSTYPNLLSNGNKIKEEQLDHNRLAVTWQDPFPKPSYLFALVAGNLAMVEDEFVTMSGRRITLQIFSEPHNIGQCDYAMEVLKRSMAWDEERFGREYDLDIFMIVAVEDFNMGAMENKGLNIFNTACVLASPDTATDLAYQRVEAVVAHEYFHNWSGNRVTCRDWFQLSLKEGFTVFRDAEFSSDMNSRAVKRIEDVQFLRAIQFAEDAGPLAHPVRPQSYLEISNFYTTTIYEKGAEVVRMYQTLLGDEQFRQGSDLYFARFDGQAVTTDDFAQAMSEVSDRDLSQFKLWYDQAGTPVLMVSDVEKDGVCSFRVEQSCPSTPGQKAKKPFHMPILFGLLDQQGNQLELEQHELQLKGQTHSTLQKHAQGWLLELRDDACEIVVDVAVRPVLSFLRGFSAPVRLHYDRPTDDLITLVRDDVDGFVRWDAMMSLWLPLFSQQQEIPDKLVELVGTVAEKSIEEINNVEQTLLNATLLNIPDENYLFEQLSDLDVDLVLNQHKALTAKIAQTYVGKFQTLYELCYPNQLTSFSADAEGVARRSMGNLAFAYLCEVLTGESLATFVQQHYDRADNLTDRRAALSQACRNDALDSTVASNIIEDFYNKWQHEALVLDLWFNLQAQSPLNGVAKLAELENHEKFERTNPNRVRSVYGAFGNFNHAQLHALDGSGYEFLSDRVAMMDELNPQIASRLCQPLTRWRRYDSKRQQLMKAALEKLSARDSISKDLFEIVSKSLLED